MSKMETIGEFEYNKKDLIGHGAFAVVFRGRNKKKHDLTVAIKCITKKNLAKSQNLLSKEIKILKELSDLHHDNVVALLDCKETSHHVYLVMEYCNGGDLADYLQAKGTLSEDTIALFLRQIAGAMKALNAKGVVHRDLKPQNILLNHSGKSNPSPSEIQLKIADFGFARFLQDGVMAATLCGSPMYMAPEVIMSIQYDAKADLWSIGTIVYQCLTGKAPFQAQTPQQLKQFYEKNANLQPNIPSGTSPELRALLLCLLKRNAKDRIDFDVFFRHPFLSTGLQPKSSPVPVPRSRSRTSIGESPHIKTVSASPLSGHVPMSSGSGEMPRGAAMGVDVGSPREVGGFLNVCKMEQDPSPRPGSPSADDYVMVPENVPSDQSVSSAGSHRNPGSVDLNAIFSDNSTPDSPRPTMTKQAPEQASPSETSPSRPNNLALQSPTSKASAPIPVPSQSYRMSPSSPATPKGNMPSPQSPQVAGSAPSKQGLSHKSSNSSLPSVGSMSPPAVQFTIGTPPSTSWARRGSWGTPPSIRAGTTPPAPGSPLRRVVTAPLPTIMGSPTKNLAHINFPVVQPAKAPSPSAEPLHAPFAHRTKTFPDNITAVGFHDDNRSIVPLSASRERCSTVPEALFRGSNNNPLLSEHLLKAAFAPSGSFQGLGHADSRQAVVAYGCPHHGMDIPGRRDQGSGNDNYPFFNTPPKFAHSPPNMEGPISFVAPELAEETLMDKTHNETVAKLNFVQALVDCVIELAQSRASPITESYTRQQGDAFTLDRVAFVSEEQRCLEQLVLYMRALQLLTASFTLARTEIKNNRLQPSNSVKEVLKSMKLSYHRCLLVCKQLNKEGLAEKTCAVTADRLIYAYALEMCQTAALDEIFGNPHECFRHYRSAQILLHSLAQQAQDSRDKQLLNQYKESVERRLFNLYEQGYIQS